MEKTVRFRLRRRFGDARPAPAEDLKEIEPGLFRDISGTRLRVVQTSTGEPTEMPENAGGATPTIVTGSPFLSIVLPIAPGSSANRRRQ